MYALPTISQAFVTSALHRFRRDLRANGHKPKTILTDNGSEFLHEDTLEALLHVPIHYCHPYSAWEKGCFFSAAVKSISSIFTSTSIC